MAITDITLSNSTIIEGSTSGTLVGDITIVGSFIDVPVAYITSNQFKIVSGTPNKLVVLDGSLLDFESQPTVNVVIGAYIQKRITEITKTGAYNVIKTSTDHNLTVGDTIEITSSTKCNGTHVVTTVPDDTTFYIALVPDFGDIELYGYVYTTRLEKPITINVTDSAESQSIIYSVTPQASLKGTFPEITISGLKFTEGGAPIVILNGVTQTLTSYSDTSIVFTLITDLDYGVYDLTVVNGYEWTQLQNDPLYEADLVSIKLIRYITDQQVSYSLGNTNCYVKPTIQLVYDTDGASGKYGSIMSVIPANVYMEYLHIYLKHNANFDFSTGGEVTLDNVKLLAGDLVWLSNQTISGENGIYTVSETAWTFVKAVDSNTFIDLGARARALIENTSTNTTTCQPNDEKYVMGDVSREIVIDQHIKFGKTGFYSITYYILDIFGILSKVIRKVKILTSGASISPSDAYKITDYSIKTEVDPDLLLSGNTTDNSTSTCCTSNSGSSSTGGSSELTSNDYINRKGTVIFIADQSMGGHKLTNLGDAVEDTDAVNLGQVKELILSNNAAGSMQTAGETINVFQPVYMHTDGLVYVAKSNDINLMGKVIGIATSTKNINESIRIINIGELSDVPTPLQTGLNYYISSTGYLTYIPPTTGFVQIMGIASSTSDFILLMHPPIGLE
jgi:hypothetical protein